MSQLEAFAEQVRRTLPPIKAAADKATDMIEAWAMSGKLDTRKYRRALTDLRKAIEAISAVKVPTMRPGEKLIVEDWIGHHDNLAGLSLGSLKRLHKSGQNFDPQEAIDVIRMNVLDVVPLTESRLRQLLKLQFVDKEFAFEGFTVTDTYGLMADQVRPWLETVTRTVRVLKRAGLDYLVYGKLHLAQGSRWSGLYQVQSDTISLDVASSKIAIEGMVTILVHELGHRLWYKFLDGGARDRFATPWLDREAAARLVWEQYREVFDMPPQEPVKAFELAWRTNYDLKQFERWMRSSKERTLRWLAYLSHVYPDATTTFVRDGKLAPAAFQAAAERLSNWQAASDDPDVNESNQDSLERYRKRQERVWTDQTYYNSVTKLTFPIIKSMLEPHGSGGAYRVTERGEGGDILRELFKIRPVDFSVTPYGNTNRAEDFAETFASVVLRRNKDRAVQERLQAVLPKGRVLSAAEPGIADRTTVNLQREYDKWNGKLWGGRLPKVPLKWVQSKRVAGRVVSHGVRDDPSTWTIKRLEMSDFMELPYQHFLGLLVHEMVHVHLIANGVLDRGGQHGLRFMDELSRVRKLVPFDVPVTEDITKQKVSKQVAVKPVGVVLFGRRGAIQVYAEAAIQQVMSDMAKLPADWLERQQLEFYVVADPELAKYQVKRKFSKGKVSFYPVDADQIERIRKGRRLGSLPVTARLELPARGVIRDAMQQRSDAIARAELDRSVTAAVGQDWYGPRGQRYRIVEDTGDGWRVEIQHRSSNIPAEESWTFTKPQFERLKRSLPLSREASAADAPPMPFKVGDLVKYGKYKNKSGKIVRFGRNPKGQITVLVDPVPKGRKQTKEMGLFKIWTTPDAIEAVASTTAAAITPLDAIGRAAARALDATYEVDGTTLKFEWLSVDPKQPTHRRATPRLPRNNVIQFAEDPNRNRHYGAHRWTLLTRLPYVANDKQVLKIAMDEFDTDEGDALDLINPSNIVDTAGAWDNQDFVSRVWEELRAAGYETQDGAVVIDPTSVKLEYDYDGSEFYRLAATVRLEIAGEQYRWSGSFADTRGRNVATVDGGAETAKAERTFIAQMRTALQQAEKKTAPRKYRATAASDPDEGVEAVAASGFDRVLSSSTSKKLRDDFLMLMKNIKKLKTYKQTLQWHESVQRWGQKLEHYIESAATELGRMTSSGLPRNFVEMWQQSLKSAVYPLIFDVQSTGFDRYELATRYTYREHKRAEVEELLVRDFHEQSAKYERRVKRVAREAWKNLDATIATIQASLEERGIAGLDVPQDERIDIEGFNVTLTNLSSRGYYKPKDAVDNLRRSLAHYKKRAAAVFPWLLRYRLPIVLDGKLSLDDAAHYEPADKTIWMRAAAEAPERIAHVLAHEMAHHVWRHVLSKQQQEYWEAAIKGSRGPLDLREVMKLGSFSGLNKDLMRKDPILALRIQTFIHDPRFKHHDLSTKKGLERYLQTNEPIVQVTTEPITGYAAKNPEEAFCEALGLLVGYGPRAVLPIVRERMRMLLPQLKVQASVIEAANWDVMSRQYFVNRKTGSVLHHEYMSHIDWARDEPDALQIDDLGSHENAREFAALPFSVRKGVWRNWLQVGLWNDGRDMAVATNRLVQADIRVLQRFLLDIKEKPSRITVFQNDAGFAVDGDDFMLAKSPRDLVTAAAPLAQQLTTKMEALFRNFNEAESKKVAEWFEQSFGRIKQSRTPSGGKKVKEAADHMLWELKHRASQYKDQERARQQVEVTWREKMLPLVPQLIKLFSDEGGVDVPTEMEVGGRIYLNRVGLVGPKLRAFVNSLESLWKGLKGWRRQALAGKLKIALAGPKDFRGTAAGVYRSEQDTLYVRATPKVLKRQGGSYGSPDYILVHELGHRYERKVRLSTDFDQQMWWTTPYSRKDGEQFAELFACGHFGIRNWGPKVEFGDKLDRFEAVMSGAKVEEKPELPEHLKRFARGAATDELYHTTSLKGLAKILQSRTFLGGRHGGFVSFSEKPLFGDIQANDAVLVLDRTKLRSRVMPVEYTEQWYERYPEHAAYVAGEGWREQYEEPEDCYDEEGWADGECVEQAYRDAELQAFLDKSDERESIGRAAGDLRLPADAFKRVVVPRQKLATVEALLKKLGLKMPVKVLRDRSTGRVAGR